MAAVDAARGVDPQPDQHVAAKGLRQRQALAGAVRRDRGAQIAGGQGVQHLLDQRLSICSISDRLWSISLMRIQARALTSPSCSTGTSKRSRSYGG